MYSVWKNEPLIFFRYMLTHEGREAARECLMRSGLTDSIDILPVEQDSDLDACNTPDLELANSSSSAEVTLQSVSLSQQSKSVDVPLASLERVCFQLDFMIIPCSANPQFFSITHRSFHHIFPLWALTYITLFFICGVTIFVHW